MTIAPLPISDVVTVTVSAAAGAVAPATFNVGLIVGSSTHIPSYGANSLVREYASLAEMSEDGFLTTDPEYIAAELYFSQSPTAPFVWVGRQDLTAIATAIPHSGNAGTGYVVGDQVTVVQGGGSNGILTVTTVGGSGAVTGLAISIGNQGTGYAVANGLATTGGSGTNLEVDITAIGQTLLQAVQAIYQASAGDWYAFMCCGATDADHLALGAYSSANWQNVMYVGSSATAAIVAGTAGNIALEMKAVKDRALLSYNTAQAGSEFPDNLYAAAAIVGLAMGLNTGAPASAFDLNLKSLNGVAPEQLTQTQITALLGTEGNNGQNCNSCVSYGPFIGYLVNGILSSGEWFDQILYRAMLVNLIQINVMNLLVTSPKIPQTDAGEHQLIAAVQAACSSMAVLGYIGPGVWEGASIILAGQTTPILSNGQSLPNGYSVFAPSYATQSSGDRAARKAMPITAAIIESGAVNSVIVNVVVQP